MMTITIMPIIKSGSLSPPGAMQGRQTRSKASSMSCSSSGMMFTPNDDGGHQNGYGEFDAYGYDDNDAYSTIFVNIKFMRIL